MTTENVNPEEQQAEQAKTAATDAAKSGNFEAALNITDWKGHENYACAICGDASTQTLDKQKVLTHIERSHGPAPVAPERVVPGMVDRFGNPVTVPGEAQPQNPQNPTIGVGAQ